MGVGKWIGIAATCVVCPPAGAIAATAEICALTLDSYDDDKETKSGNSFRVAGKAARIGESLAESVFNRD